MDGFWQAVLLGILEGLTEFLPISSTAHLLVAADLLGFSQDAGGTFEIFIQFGAVLAVLGYYARDLMQQARALPADRSVRKFWACVLMAFLPAALAGFLLRDWIKAVLFNSPELIAGSLIAGGVVFIVVERIPLRPPTVRQVTTITFRQALVVGVIQTLALVPGVSRSGAAIVGGLLLGLDRQTATIFSFYLAIPTLGAATLYDLVSSFSSISPDDYMVLLVGTVVALLTSWISIGWLLRYVAGNSLVGFGVYRILAGLAILLLAGAGLL